MRCAAVRQRVAVARPCFAPTLPPPHNSVTSSVRPQTPTLIIEYESRVTMPAVLATIPREPIPYHQTHKARQKTKPLSDNHCPLSAPAPLGFLRRLAYPFFAVCHLPALPQAMLLALLGAPMTRGIRQKMLHLRTKVIYLTLQPSIIAQQVNSGFVTVSQWLAVHCQTIPSLD